MQKQWARLPATGPEGAAEIESTKTVESDSSATGYQSSLY